MWPPWVGGGSQSKQGGHIGPPLQRFSTEPTLLPAYASAVRIKPTPVVNLDRSTPSARIEPTPVFNLGRSALAMRVNPTACLLLQNALSIRVEFASSLIPQPRDEAQEPGDEIRHHRIRERGAAQGASEARAGGGFPGGGQEEDQGEDHSGAAKRTTGHEKSPSGRTFSGGLHGRSSPPGRVCCAFPWCNSGPIRPFGIVLR